MTGMNIDISARLCMKLCGQALMVCTTRYGQDKVTLA